MPWFLDAALLCAKLRDLQCLTWGIGLCHVWKREESVSYVLHQTKYALICTVTPPKTYYQKGVMGKDKLRYDNTLKDSQRLCLWQSWKWLDLLTDTLCHSPFNLEPSGKNFANFSVDFLLASTWLCNQQCQ